MQRRTEEEKAAQKSANTLRWYKEHPDRAKEIAGAWRKRNPRRGSDDSRLRLYGMSPEQFDEMLVAQVGRCALCDEPMEKPHVDHDHKTGKVRGLLHSTCNTGLGNFKDDPDVLQKAIEYLRRQD